MSISQRLVELMDSERRMHAEIEAADTELWKKRLQFSKLQETINELLIQDATRKSASASAPPVGRFQLRAITPRGASMVDALDAVLARLPHTGDV